MSAFQTIVPIFIIILLGALARQKGFITPAFLGPANHLVYYLAIPAMIFRAISSSSLTTELNFAVVAATVACLPAAFIFAWVVNPLMGNTGGRKGTFIQCAFHGNLGYIGFAVAFYYLGDKGFVRASIVAGFVMIVQNLLAVLALQFFGQAKEPGSRLKIFLNRVLINPVIISALFGIGWAALAIPIPVIIDRGLKILSGLALPMALLLIGASLSFSLVKIQLWSAMACSVIKLMVLPGLGLVVYRLMGLSAGTYMPGLILLAAPSATLTYVFANEMHGDPDLAAASISVGTILSGLTYAGWLHLAA